jgi:hypothetical protein
MKHSEFSAFWEPPIQLKLEPIEDNQVLPEKGTILESFGIENIIMAELYPERPIKWGLKSSLPDRYIEKRTLFFIRDSNPDTSVVTVYPVPLQNAFTMDKSQKIAIDDRAVEDLKSRIPDLYGAEQERICSWVMEEFILDPLKQKGCPALLVGIYAEETEFERAGGFSILGRSYIAGLSITKDDHLLIKQFRKIVRKPPFLSLWEGPFSFTLDTQEAKMKDPIFLQQFEERRQDPSAFLNIWEHYLKLDEERLNNKLKNAGELVYQNFEAMGEGSKYRLFSLKKTELEAARTFVEILTDSPEDDQIIEIQGKDGIESHDQRFKFVEFDESSNTIKVEVAGHTRTKNIPKQGIITLSLHGWKIANKRRRAAFDKIINQQNGIYNLYYHLYEKPLPVRERPQPIRIRESQIYSAFGEDTPPNSRQVEAITTCLESHDIVLIQGPPGTGKTKVISVLQKLLEKQNRKTERLPSILLTSYQHDAVDNMAQKSRILGLPPYRYGGKDSQQSEQGFIEWRDEMIAHVKGSISKLESSPLIKELQQLKKDIFRLQSSRGMPPTSYTKLFESVIDRCKTRSPELIKTETLFDFESVYKNLLRNRYADDPKNREIRRKIWGLRITSEGYSDDGFINLRSLVDTLRIRYKINPDSTLVEQSLINRLSEIAENREEVSDDFLIEITDIRNHLLESTMGDPLWRVSNPVDENMQDIMDRVIKDINESLQRLPEGASEILDDFLDKISNFSMGIRESIAHYTLAYATTVQKSVANRFLDLRSRHIQQMNDQGKGFDYVIIDEAARANPLDLFIPMSLAKKKILLVGDHLQLPQTLEPEIEKDFKASNNADKNNTPAKAIDLKESLFERMWKYFKTKPDGKTLTVSLDTQYRMHPELGKFISRVFYEPEPNCVTIHTTRKAEEFKHTVARYENKFAVWEDCPEEIEINTGLGYYRTIEAEKIVQIAVDILKNSSESVGIITMYKKQEKEIIKKLELKELIKSKEIVEQYRGRLRVGTVDSFQGREFDVVLLSPVRNNNYPAKTEEQARHKFGFLTFKNRLNVALSRQRKLLVVVGCRKMFQTDEAEKYVTGLFEFQKMCEASF